MTDSTLELTGPTNLKVGMHVLVGLLATEVVLVSLAFLWVFIYSTVINTGGDEAYYQAYAQVSSPVVAVVGSFPVFFVMARMFRNRLAERALVAAFVTVAINLAIDLPLVVMMAEDMTYNLTAAVLAATGKVLGAYFGARPARASS